MKTSLAWQLSDDSNNRHITERLISILGVNSKFPKHFVSIRSSYSLRFPSLLSDMISLNLIRPAAYRSFAMSDKPEAENALNL